MLDLIFIYGKNITNISYPKTFFRLKDGSKSVAVVYLNKILLMFVHFLESNDFSISSRRGLNSYPPDSKTSFACYKKTLGPILMKRQTVVICMRLHTTKRHFYTK